MTPLTPEQIINSGRHGSGLGNEATKQVGEQLAQAYREVDRLTKELDRTLANMVDRFLNWRLPHDFAPDCGITFDGCKPDALGYAPSWPVGTNLLTADQARAMIKYIIHGEVKK